MVGATERQPFPPFNLLFLVPCPKLFLCHSAASSFSLMRAAQEREEGGGPLPMTLVRDMQETMTAIRLLRAAAEVVRRNEHRDDEIEDAAGLFMDFVYDRDDDEEGEELDGDEEGESEGDDEYDSREAGDEEMDEKTEEEERPGEEQLEGTEQAGSDSGV